MRLIKSLLFLVLSFALTHPRGEADKELSTPRLEPRGFCIESGSRVCITYFGGDNCNDPLDSYSPTCNGNCFQYNLFQSLELKDSIFYSSKCLIYSDVDCNNQIGDSGDAFDTVYMNPRQSARSMKCYFNC